MRIKASRRCPARRKTTSKGSNDGSLILLLPNVCCTRDLVARKRSQVNRKSKIRHEKTRRPRIRETVWEDGRDDRRAWYNVITLWETIITRVPSIDIGLTRGGDFVCEFRTFVVIIVFFWFGTTMGWEPIYSCELQHADRSIGPFAETGKLPTYSCYMITIYKWPQKIHHPIHFRRSFRSKNSKYQSLWSTSWDKRICIIKFNFRNFIF